MKHLIFALFAATLLLSCSKNEYLGQPQQEETYYRVKVVGKGDTTTSTSMFARTETVGLVVAEDDKLKAELIAYNGAGVYTVQVTSKLECQSIVRWGWDGLTIDSISPASDVLPPLGTVIFTLYGDHHVGKIKLKTESDCGNSSTLIINITNTILPVVFIENTAKLDPKTGKVMVSFTIDDPTQAEWIIIEKLTKEKVWVQAALIAGDLVTKAYIIKL